MTQASTYPKSVNPGIPQQLPTPQGWSKVKYGAFLYPVQRLIELEDDAQYQLITVKRSRGGIASREILKGKEIKTPNQHLIKEGDFLISRRQIVHGACGIVPIDFDNSVVSTEYSILNSRRGLNLHFFKYFTHTPYFQQTCFHSSVGVHVEKMIFKLEQWLEWEFNLPPLPEQCKIAEILSTWDKAIALLEQLITAKRKLKQGLMQQLLTGKKRFKEFEDSEWETVTLSDVCKFIKDGTHGTHQRIDNGIPMLSATNITKSGQVCFGDISMIPEEDYTKIHAKYEIQNYDILLTIVGTLGRSAIVKDLPKFTVQRSVAIIRVDKNKINPIYLYCISNSSEFQYQLQKRANITAQAGVYLGELAKISVLLPPLLEQQKIASILSTADTEISNLEKQLAAYKQQKRGLMQQLLTGKKRVKIDEPQLQKV